MRITGVDKPHLFMQICFTEDLSIGHIVSLVVTRILPPEYLAENGFVWVANCLGSTSSLASIPQNSSNFTVP